MASGETRMEMDSKRKLAWAAADANGAACRVAGALIEDPEADCEALRAELEFMQWFVAACCVGRRRP